MSDPHPELTAAMRDYARRAKTELNYFPHFFMQMLGERYGYETATALVQAPHLSEGFSKLAEKGRLDFTVEAMVLRPQWSGLFQDEILEKARERLTAYGYNFPADAWTSDSPPATKLGGSVVPERISVTVDRIVRDGPLAGGVKILHDHKCQLCGVKILLPGNRAYAEAHHIRPLGGDHWGPDEMGNLLCVCPNCHVKLDYLAVRLDAGSFTTIDGHEIDQRHIDYHNERFDAQQSDGSPPLI